MAGDGCGDGTGQRGLTSSYNETPDINNKIIDKNQYMGSVRYVII